MIFGPRVTTFTPCLTRVGAARRFSGFPFLVNFPITGEALPSFLLTFLSRLWIMEQVFSDALGLFGAEIEEDDGYVYYGGLKLGVAPKVWNSLNWDRLIVDGRV